MWFIITFFNCLQFSWNESVLIRGSRLSLLCSWRCSTSHQEGICKQSHNDMVKSWDAPSWRCEGKRSQCCLKPAALWISQSYTTETYSRSLRNGAQNRELPYLYWSERSDTWWSQNSAIILSTVICRPNAVSDCGHEPPKNVRKDFFFFLHWEVFGLHLDWQGHTHKEREGEHTDCTCTNLCPLVEEVLLSQGHPFSKGFCTQP